MRATGQPISMLRRATAWGATTVVAAGAAAACGFATAVFTGCKSAPTTQPAANPPAATAPAAADDAPRDPLHPTMETVGTESPVAGNAAPVMIKRGKPPLAYLVGTDGDFSVMDETSNAFVGGGPAAAQSIVSVDARNGVRIGGAKVAPGPLDRGHDYGIYLVPPGDNVARQITRRPRPIGAGGADAPPQALPPPRADGTK